MANRNAEGLTQVNIFTRQIIENQRTLSDVYVDTQYALVSSNSNENLIVFVSIDNYPFKVSFKSDPTNPQEFHSTQDSKGYQYLRIPYSSIDAAPPYNVNEDIYQDYPYELTIELPPHSAAGGSAVAAPSSATVQGYARGRRRGWLRH